MGRKQGRELLVVRDIWEAYAQKLMGEEEGIVGVNNRNARVKNYWLYKKTGQQIPNVTSRRRTDVIRYQNRVWFISGKILEEVKPFFDYNIFRDIIEKFFNSAQKRVIYGEALHLLHCGKIYAKRVQRDYRKKGKQPINWAKTKQGNLKEGADGKLHYEKIYRYSSDDWCRINWQMDKQRNTSYYEFVPTEDTGDSENHKNGFADNFSRALIADPSLKYKYLYEPLKPYNQNRKTS